jgi:hypothetical protein
MAVLEYSLQQLREFSITTGAVLQGDLITAVFTSDARLLKDPEDRHSYLGARKGQTWRILESAYPVRSQAFVTVPDECVISISDVGNVRRSAVGGSKDEANVGDVSGKRVLSRSRLFEVRAVAGTAYTVGTRRSAYFRTAPGTWECIDQDCYVRDDFEAGFQSIHGFSRDEVYAVGTRGEIWQYDGKTWLQRDSGTNVTLHRVLCAFDGHVYVVGKNGTVIRGRHDVWSPVVPPSQYEYWDIQDYKDRIFLTANTRLTLELTEKQGIQLVDFKDCTIPTTAYHLTVGAGCLYLFGGKDIRKFDGNAWEEVLSLD